MTPRRIGPCLALAAALAAGCSGGPREKPVFPVRGRVTYENRPVAKAVIIFHSADPNDRGTASHATADDDGRYALHTYRVDDGAPAGDYVVTVYWPAPRLKSAAGGLTPDADNPNEFGTIDRLKNKYSHVDRSKLRATVGPTDNEINLNLP